MIYYCCGTDFGYTLCVRQRLLPTASKIGCCTMALGRYLAPHIKRQGTKLLTSTCNLTELEASTKMDGVLEVAAGAVEGFGTVYDGLEKSAGLLASSLANNTVKIVEHK